jgi:hypothetical protein
MSGPAVRELVPIDRISVARIRQIMRKDEPLGRWSRCGAGAIRPGLLANLVRDCIWGGLDIPLGEVRARLGKPGDEARYRMTVEVEVGPNGQCCELEAQARFVRRVSGRITAHIELCTDGQPIVLNASTILLAAP